MCSGGYMSRRAPSLPCAAPRRQISRDNEKMTFKLGSPYYVAPEVLDESVPYSVPCVCMCVCAGEA